MQKGFSKPYYPQGIKKLVDFIQITNQLKGSYIFKKNNKFLTIIYE